MSTFNGEDYILEQLNSLYDQDMPANEVLIFDDCSTDNTPIIISRFIQEKNLRNWFLHINTHNKGWRKNFMCGMSQAHGDYIFPCDQDDIWEPCKIREMVKVMECNSDIALLTSNYCAFFDNGSHAIGPNKENLKIIRPNLGKKLFYIRYPGCTYCIRRTFFCSIKNYWVPTDTHDGFVWKYAMMGKSIAFYNKTLIKWRKHDDSTGTLESYALKTANGKYSFIVSALQVLEKMLVYFDKEKNEKAVKIIQLNIRCYQLRKNFYETKNPLIALQLLRYIDCYPKTKQYLGDLYLVYLSK